MTKNDNYIAVLGDAIASRTLSPAARAAAQADLRRAIGVVNRRWRGAVAAKFVIALGDQFEGLLRDDAPLWDVLHVLRAELVDADWVLVAARGGITTPLARTAIEVDGPCFHAARTALETAKRDGQVLALAGFADPVQPLARYYSALHASWTARQRRAAALLRTVDAVTAAQRLGVDRSAVSHLARRMGWSLVESGDRDFRRILEAR